MIAQYTPRFVRKLKSCDKGVRMAFRRAIILFTQDPLDPSLRFHKLRDKWHGYWSIDVTDDYRAVCMLEQNATAARFHAIGTHEELYG